MLVRWAPDGHVWHFPYNLPVHCKIQKLRSHAHRLIPPGCDAAQQWLDDWTCCRTQRWDQDHLVLGPACDIPPDHQIFGPHNTFSETHERHLWVNIIMISNYMSFVYQTSVSLIHHWILLHNSLEKILSTLNIDTKYVSPYVFSFIWATIRIPKIVSAFWIKNYLQIVRNCSVHDFIAWALTPFVCCFDFSAQYGTVCWFVTIYDMLIMLAIVNRPVPWDSTASNLISSWVSWDAKLAHRVSKGSEVHKH